jgi:hypothetical protein
MAAPCDISDSDTSDDEEIVDALVETLLGDTDVRKYSNRTMFDKTMVLVNFNVCEDGPVNYRDGNVLGDHTAVVLPSLCQNATRVKISVHLNYEFEPNAATMVNAPTLVCKHLRATSQQLAGKWPLEPNELWLVPAELGPSLKVDFKKRHWDLSMKFRKASGCHWPNFVLLAEAYMPNGSIVRVISDEFEVRSKEQSNKSRAARGMATAPKRRRTPETEARAAKLRARRADIIEKREQIAKTTSQRAENTTKFQFMQAILKTCSDPAAAALLKRCQQQAVKMTRWKHN